jgi:hypothetical protein
MKDNKSLFFITDFKQDVMGYQFIEIKNKKEIQSEFEQIHSLPSNDPQRLPSLAKLKQELNKVEREEISNKLQDHTIRQTGFVKYGDQLSALKSLKQYSKQ